MIEEIGKRLKDLRNERDLSIDMLVADMNRRYKMDKPLNKSMVSRWENDINDPTLENAIYLSMYYNVSLDYLTGLSNTRAPSVFLR